MKKSILLLTGIVTLACSVSAMAANTSSTGNLSSTKCQLGQTCHFDNGIAYYHVLINPNERSGTFTCTYHNNDKNGKVSFKRAMAYYTGFKNTDFATELRDNQPVTFTVQKRLTNLHSEAQIKIEDLTKNTTSREVDTVFCDVAQ